MYCNQGLSMVAQAMKYRRNYLFKEIINQLPADFFKRSVISSKEAVFCIQDRH
jgi:hypothetical protein